MKHQLLDLLPVLHRPVEIASRNGRSDLGCLTSYMSVRQGKISTSPRGRSVCCEPQRGSYQPLYEGHGKYGLIPASENFAKILKV